MTFKEKNLQFSQQSTTVVTVFRFFHPFPGYTLLRLKLTPAVLSLFCLACSLKPSSSRSPGVGCRGGLRGWGVGVGSDSSLGLGKLQLAAHGVWWQELIYSESLGLEAMLPG